VYKYIYQAMLRSIFKFKFWIFFIKFTKLIPDVTSKWSTDRNP